MVHASTARVTNNDESRFPCNFWKIRRTRGKPYACRTRFSATLYYSELMRNYGYNIVMLLFGSVRRQRLFEIDVPVNTNVFAWLSRRFRLFADRTLIYSVNRPIARFALARCPNRDGMGAGYSWMCCSERMALGEPLYR